MIVIMVGSTTCRQEILNTINTIKSYQGAATSRQKPINAIYLENGKKTMQENDAVARMNILLMAALWSGENHGMDSRDLHNFLNYTNVGNYPAALSGLRIYTKGDQAVVEKGRAVSSVLSMVREGEDPDPGMIVGYHSFGQFSQAASDAVKMPTPVHLHTVQGYFTNIVDGLQVKLDEVDELHRVNTVNTLNLKDVSTDDIGMVL